MLTSAELTSMASVAESSMLDTAVIRTATTTYDAVGGAVQSWTESLPVRCGVEYTSERTPETIEIAGVRYAVDATIRLPVAMSVASTDQIKVTRRYGATLSPAWLFEVLGTPRRGPTAYIIKARQIL